MAAFKSLQRVTLFVVALAAATLQLCAAHDLSFQQATALRRALQQSPSSGSELGGWLAWWAGQQTPAEEPAEEEAPAPAPVDEAEGPTAPPPTPPQAPSPGTCADGAAFERVFRDDFDGSAVSGDWTLYNSPGNAGFGLRRPSAFSVEDGMLVITAQMQDGSLVSGGMSHNYAQQYGKYVARVRTDRDPSVATSGVVLTWPESNVHPRDGENNIYETTQSDGTRSPFYSFIHKPFGAATDQEYKEHFADGTQFQTMSMEWTPDRITITREGPGDTADSDVWVVDETAADLIPDVPHRMTVQLDAWEDQMGDPVRMEVDFVEVYKYCL